MRVEITRGFIVFKDTFGPIKRVSARSRALLNVFLENKDKERKMTEELKDFSTKIFLLNDAGE